MKTFSLTTIMVLCFAFAKAQVGIGTTTPQATLDIVASDITAPSNEDGLLIPRIENFPATNPTTTQDGMMVFVTGNGAPTKGFYYWDHTAVNWVGVSGASGGANTLDQAYDQGGAGAGKNIDANNGAVRINGTDGLVVTGIQGSGNTIDTEITGAGTRLFFNPSTGSFRAGSVLGSEWDHINIGVNSTAIGNSTTASGPRSFAQGSNTIASGFGAVSFGLFSISSNTYSLATGQSTIASGVNSATFGRNTRAPSYAEMAIGSFPRIYSATGVSVIDLSDRAFVIGNGTGVGALSHNAFEVWKNGRVEINEEYSLPTTDGTTGQVMTSDGAGNITFQDITSTGAERLNDLIDGKSDNDGTQDGSSIFLGENAGNADNSTDNRNIGIGFQSLNTNVTGQNNVAIGYQSLENNRGSNNIGVGNLTLNSVLATGFRNIAIGQNTQIATTTGDDNIAIGDNTMVANTLARFNVAIGTRALTATTTNGQNTAIGHESLTANTGGTNTALGFESLTANTTGIENVALGHQAGVSNTGDGNIFIGKSAGAQETTANDKLYIENSNANADNALIYGEFDNDILRTNGEFQINNPATTGYAFPIADGTANQVLTTDGAGNTSWQNSGGGAERINDLIDGKSDDNGTNDGSSIFLGINAGLNDDETNNQNIGIGFDALTSNTSGNSNLGIGFRALASTTTASGNIGVGALTLEDNTTGASNIAIGLASLNNNTTAFGNVAIGSLSMSTNTVGGSNVAIGNLTLLENTGGFSNTAIGANSLQENTTGTNNSATGRQSLQENTTGGNNVANGFRSLYFNTTGSNNVTMGYRSLYFNNTGDRNIAIGYQSGYNETGSDKLYIENSNSSTPLIYGTFNTDEVGINWNSTIALPNTLSVNGNASKTTAGAWLANSDARLKTDIKTMDSKEMLAKVLAMRGVTYKWNDDKTGLERPDTIQYGFIAQDLQKIWPTKVSEDGQGYLQTAYGDYDAMFVEAFKAQQAQINTLKKENQALQNKVQAYATLEARLQQIEKQLGTASTSNTAVVSGKE